jgi:DNA-binding transcriptional LysR family regulator
MLLRPSIRQIEMFLGLAEAGNFSDAADRLGISQSGLSQSIAQMEYVLGIKLFDRTTRQVKLTQAGAQFKTRAERVFAEYELAVDDINRLADPHQGRVTVACISSVAVHLLPRVIAAFRDKSPRVTVAIRDDNSAGVIARLKSGEVDFAVGSFMDDDPTIDFVPIIHDRYGVVCRHEHPLARQDQIKWEDLKEYSFCAFAPETETSRHLRQALQGKLDIPRSQYNAFHLSTILGLVERGIGVTVLPYLATPTSGTLCRRRLGSPVVARTLGTMAREGRSLSPEAQAFKECLIDQMVKLPQDSADVTLCAKPRAASKRPTSSRRRRT